MAIVNMRTLLTDAKRGRYGLGCFNVANLEMILGTVRAAEALHSPLMMQIAESRLVHSPLEVIGPPMVEAARKAKVPVAIHFDHGKTESIIHRALDYGFTSVMFDGSSLPFEENVKNTLQIKKLAEQYGAAIEAEIGSVGGNEGGTGSSGIVYSDPETAKRFYEETGVDALAIAIGNAHGFYVEKPNLRFDILESIHNATPVPLVLHGGSGLTDEDYRTCIRKGMVKLNIATATFQKVYETVKHGILSEEIVSYYDLHESEIQGAYENVKRHIKVFESEGKVPTA